MPFLIEIKATGDLINPAYFPFLGFVVGLFSGLLGLGGGWLITPALNVLGIPAAYCVGTSLTQMVPTTATGAFKHFRLGNLNLKLASLIAIPLISGVYLGRSTTLKLEEMHLADDIIRIAHIVVASFLGISMTIDLVKGKEKTATDSRLKKLMPKFGPIISVNNQEIYIVQSTSIGCLAGFVSGLMGIGGGLIMIPALIYVFAIPASQAVATNLFCVVMGSLNGAILYGVEGKVEYSVAGFILLGSLIGSYTGASLSKYAAERELKFYFVTLLFATVTSLVLKLFGMDIAASSALFGVALILTLTVLYSTNKQRIKSGN